MEPSSRSIWLIPAAIILAGLILAIAIFVVRVRSAAEIPNGGEPSAVRPVTPTDHLVGNPEASVVIIEYSDIDSEHGKALHATIAQLMTEYGPNNTVAWVYRHFPMTTIHAYSLRHAVAAECASSLGGQDAFWRFIDLANTIAPGALELNPKDYPSILRQLGIEEKAFEECLTAGKFTDKVREDAHNALESGAEGAPYVVILVKGANPIGINGSLPYEAMKQVLDKALAEAK